MIRVVVVDDESEERAVLQDFFQRLQKEVGEEIETIQFPDGEDLLETYDHSFDMICLDIDLGGQDGIRGYEVRALDFLVKPVNYYSFSMKMRSAVNIIKRRKSRQIVLQTPGGIQKISTDQLFYVEVNGHYLYYHTPMGVFKQKAPLRELEDKLSGLSFRRCNNCYLVNLKYVDCVNKDDIQIAGEWLKISRPRKKEFLQALANYMGGVDKA